jgi:outer membrane protein OmpA-like peptidoglycan-associated protein
VHSFSGKSSPPRELQWESPALFKPKTKGGLNMGYVLRVVDENGGGEDKSGVIASQSLLDIVEKASHQGAKERQELEALARGFSKCRVAPDYGTCECTFNFESGSEAIDLTEWRRFNEFAHFLRVGGLTHVLIQGHADNTGDPRRNARLSALRAEAMLRRLSESKVATSAFQVQSFGDSQPLASNDTEEGRRANRRVLISAQRPWSEAPPARKAP